MFRRIALTAVYSKRSCWGSVSVGMAKGDYDEHS